jgi:hypothetical protein
VVKIFTTEFSMAPEPAATMTFVVPTDDAKSAACKLRYAANNAVVKNRIALEPAENESNAIDEPMLENGQYPCKGIVTGCRREFKRRLLREFKRRQIKVNIFRGFPANYFLVEVGVLRLPRTGVADDG